MDDCSHTTWLQLVAGQTVSICDTGRLERLVRKLADPLSQYPNALSFVGGTRMKSAIAALFKLEPSKPRIRTGVINLRLDQSTVWMDHPTFVIESHAKAEPPAEFRRQMCHEQTVRPLKWTALSHQHRWDMLHSRLLCLFVDVVCIFADDFGGLGPVIDRLKNWTLLGPTSTSVPRPVRPRVLIVSAKPDPSITSQVLDLEDTRYKLLQEKGPDVYDSFSEISFIQLPDIHLSPKARLEPLRIALSKTLAQMQQIRSNKGYRFSAQHWLFFFRRAFNNFIQPSIKPFNFVMESRHFNPISIETKTHFANFFQLADKAKMPIGTAASHAASAMILNAYPPGMHPFNPEDTYAQYKPSCQEALYQVFYSRRDLIPSILQEIENHYSVLFCQLDQRAAASVHRANALLHHKWWDLLKSNKTCLYCLRSKPEVVLSCGHSICETCVRIFATEMPARESLFRLDNCILCAGGHLSIRLKPVSAGISLLSIDGGGVRGIVPLEFIKLVQKKLGAECVIQDFIDIAVGTSSGALITLALFLLGWDIDTATLKFKEMTKKFFRRTAAQPESVYGRIKSLAKCIVSDGYYDINALEECLKDVFGFRRLFDVPSGQAGTKVAVTASNISDASTFLFSNYNGLVARDSDCGYKHIRPDDVDDEPYIWQAGRASSAAPLLFASVKIPQIGSFQDGALKRNNPIHLGLWESRLLWPSIKEPDVVLSLGTGTDMQQSPKAPTYRSFFRDGFMPRLFRSFLSTLDGQNAWQDLVNTVERDSRGKYMRLNVSLTDNLPALDDVSALSSLRRSALLETQTRSRDYEVGFSLICSRLFFLLECSPKPTSSGQYLCEGSVRCRLSGHALADVMDNLNLPVASFAIGDDVITLTNWKNDICSACHRFHKKVEFYVDSLMSQVSLKLRGLEQAKQLSAFPATMNWFIEVQQLGNYCGALDHGIPNRFRCRVCEPNITSESRNFISEGQKRLKLG